jgi:hypothetical protein
VIAIAVSAIIYVSLAIFIVIASTINKAWCNHPVGVASPDDDKNVFG